MNRKTSMKIAVTSDVHLEFGMLDIKNENNADVLILSGDILVASSLGALNDENFKNQKVSKRFHAFFQQACEQFKNVVYIMGNHEHYDGDFAYTETTIRDRLSYLKNLHFLEKGSVKIDGVTFIGGTLWTDMNNNDDMTLYHVQRRMNDFQIVENSNRKLTRRVPIYKLNEKFTEDGLNGGKYETDEKGFHIKVREELREYTASLSPEDVIPHFNNMVEYIRIIVEGKHDDKFVVCTHHAPSKSSTHRRYRNDTLMNGAYSSNLDEFILDHPQIKLWTHGHTHEDFDYMIGSTRVFCNPRGYDGYESRASRFELKIVEV